jgi:TP901 family phage tail tape measure protein
MVESVRIKFKGEDSVTPALSRINAGISSLSTRIGRVGKTFSSFNKKLLLGFTAIGAAITAIGIKAIKSFGEFDRQIKRVQVLAGGTEKDFKRLADTAFKLGSSTAFSAQEVAEAFEEFAKAGFNVNQILDASEATLGLATAGNLSLAEAVNIAVAALNAFGREAEDMNSVATILTTAFTNSAQTLQDLGQALKFVAPLASSLGISLEEVSAALGALAQVGIRSSIAGTSLNQALLQLLRPTSESSEIIEDLGVSFFTLNEAGQAARATIQATKDEFNALKERVRESDIEVARLGSQLAEAKRELKAFGGETGAADGLSASMQTLQSQFDDARLRNKELREALEAQEKTFESLRRQVREGSQDFVGLRETARQLNEAFNRMDASTIQKATALVQIFKVRGARSFLTLTKELEEFDRLFNIIAATELRTELLDESSLKAALSAQDSFARQFGITFEKLVADATEVPEGIDKALRDAKLDERARDIFRNLRNEINTLGLESEAIQAVLSDFLPLDAVKDFRKIIQLTDEDFEKFLENINAANQDAQTLNKTLLQNLGSALEELQDTITTTFIRLGGAISERLNLTEVVRNVQQAIEDFSTGGGVEKLADRIVKVFRTIGSFFKGISAGFKQVFTPDVVENLKNAFVKNFGLINREATNFGTVLGRIFGSIVKGGAELITRILNTNLIENASNAFKKLGGVLEKIGPVIGAVAAGFVLLSPILGPLFFIVSKIVGVLGFFIRGILGAGKAVGSLFGKAGKLTTLFGGVASKATSVGTAAASATAGTTGFLAKLSALGSGVSSIFSAIGSALGVTAGTAAAIVVAIVGTIIGFINQVRQNFLGLGDDFRVIFGAVINVFKAIGSAIFENLVEIGQLLKPIWEGIKETFNGLGKILASIVAIVIKPFANSLREAGEEGISAFEIIKGLVSILFAPLKLALTLIGSVLKAIGAIVNFLGDLIGGIVEFGFAVVDAFKRFREEGFSAFKDVGELAKKIGLSILKSFIGAIDSMINIFIDLINELINVARKIPLLNKLIGDNFKIDRNVLSNLIGFTKEAKKAMLPGVEEGKAAGFSFTTSAKTSLAAEGAAVTAIATEPFKQASIDTAELGLQAASNFTLPFKDPVNVNAARADVLNIFPDQAQAAQMGRNFGKAFFTGLAEGVQALAEIFEANIKPVFTTMNNALMDFITLFLRNLFTLKIVPVFLQNLAAKMFDIFVGGWHAMFTAVIDITETSINTMLSNLQKFFNQLVSVVNRLIAEYNRAADILSRDITRTRTRRVRRRTKSGRIRTRIIRTREVLFKGVNIPKLRAFSPVDLAPVQFERPQLPAAPPVVSVDAGGFSVNIENFNASSEADKQKLFAEIDAFIARKLGELVRL